MVQYCQRCPYCFLDPAKEQVLELPDTGEIYQSIRIKIVIVAWVRLLHHRILMIAIEQTLLANENKNICSPLWGLRMSSSIVSAANLTLTLNLVSLVDGILYYVMYPRATELRRSTLISNKRGAHAYRF